MSGSPAVIPGPESLGTYTPPFRDLNEEEEQSLIARVHKLKPDIIWVGISTPRQERFMHRYLDRLDTTLMFGVGAAYDFHTGRIQDAPRGSRRSECSGCIGSCRIRAACGSDICAIIQHFCGTSLCSSAVYGSTLPRERKYPPVQLDPNRRPRTDTVVTPVAASAAQLQRLGS